MKTTLLTALAAVLVTASAPGLCEPPPDADKAQLATLTSRWVAAVKSRDPGALEKILAPDFSMHTWDDSYTLDRTATLGFLLNRLHLTDYTHSSLFTTLYGDVAIVRSSWHMRGTLDGAPLGTNGDQHGITLDVWHRNGGQWQVVFRGTVTE